MAQVDTGFSYLSYSNGNPNGVSLSQARKSPVGGKFSQLLPDASLYSDTAFSSRCFLEKSQFQQTGEESTEICWMPKPHIHSLTTANSPHQSGPFLTTDETQDTSLPLKVHRALSVCFWGWTVYVFGPSWMTWGHPIICMAWWLPPLRTRASLLPPFFSEPDSATTHLVTDFLVLNVPELRAYGT